MTDEQRAYWQAYVDALKPMLRVSDWTVVIDNDQPENPNHTADVETPFGRKHATIHLSAAFLADDAIEQRQTICHELLHLHLRPIQNVFDRLLDARTEGWLRVAGELHHEQVEYAVDGIADAIAPFLPLPPPIENANAA